MNSINSELTAVAFFAMCSVCALAVPADGADTLTLARRGEAGAATVVIRHDASPSERYAAEELVRYVAKMTDVQLPVVDDSSPLPARAILLGMTRHTSALAAGAPAAVLVTQFAQLYRSEQEAQFAGSVNIMSTLLCLLTMPAVSWLYQGLVYGFGS